MSRILDTIRRKNNEKKSDVKFELNRLISVRIETETTKANNFQKKKKENNTTTIHSKATQLNQIKRCSKTIDKKLITTILSRNNIHYSSR